MKYEKPQILSSTEALIAIQSHPYMKEAGGLDTKVEPETTISAYQADE